METAPNVCDVLYGFTPPPITATTGKRPSATSTPSRPPIPAVTIRDLASFRPERPTQFMEPEGWSVVGLHTNFIARSTVHVVGGTLLGSAAEVRFRPVTYEWNYGDGATRHSAVAGATWTDLGVAEFSESATSHVYEASGAYIVGLTVRYAAEYRFASSGWRAIAGSIPVAANDLHLRVYTARTALVDDDCTVQPAATGC